jgi:hypothetical protein
MPEDSQIAVDTDNNFVGFASRLDPSNLKPGYAQSSRNMRLQRGIAQPRKGCERMTDDTLNQNMQSGSGYYVNAAGEDNVVMVFHDGIVLFNTQTQQVSQKYTFPTGRYCPIGQTSKQTYNKGTYVVAPITIPPTIPVTHYTAFAVVPTTIGVSIGDAITVGFTSLNAELFYTNFNVLDVTQNNIVFYDNVQNEFPNYITTNISLTVNSFSFEPELVQALDKLYIFRGLAGPEIVATITNPSIAGFATVTITVNTATAHGLRVGSEVNVVDTSPYPYTHGYWHKNVIVTSVASPTQFTFLFTNPTNQNIQAHTNLAGFKVQQANPPLVWDGVSASLSYVDQTGVNGGGTYPLPPGEFGLYFQNRIVVKTSKTEITATDILSDRYDPLNVYVINQGGNDSIVGALPWIENQFLLFMSKSIYVAFIDPRFDPTEPDRSQITVITTEVGCLARHSIVPAGQFVFFFSGKGVHMLTPQLDLKLLGNTLPLSEPIDDYFDNVNFDYAKSVTASYFDNRFFIAFPVGSSINNNSILVYNTLNQAWETIDTYPSGMSIDNFVPALYNNKRRLFIVSNIGNAFLVSVTPLGSTTPVNVLYGKYGGIFLAEQLDGGDEFLGVTGTPLLPFSLPATLSAASYVVVPVTASIRSREYTFDSQLTKRFSRAEFQFNNTAGDDVSILVTVHDPDVTEEVMRYVFTGSAQIDGTLRPRIAMRGVAIDTEVVFNLGRPALKSTSMYAINSNRAMITEE